MEKNHIIETWILDEILDTLRLVENYRKDISQEETCLDRKVSKAKKLLYGIKHTKTIEELFNKD